MTYQPLPIGRGWTAPLGAHLALLLAFALGLALPLVDHHAVERNPWHEHVVLGGTSLDQRQALAAHRHQYELPHTHQEVAGEPTESGAAYRPTTQHAHVVAIHPLDTVTVSSLGSAADGLVLPDPTILLPSAARAGLPFPFTPPLLDRVLPVVDPPPRTSSAEGK